VKKRVGILVPQYGVDQSLRVDDLGVSSSEYDEKTGVLTLNWINDVVEDQKDENDEEILIDSSSSQSIISQQQKTKKNSNVELIEKLELSVFSEVVVSLHVHEQRMRLQLELKIVRDKKKIANADQQKIIHKRSEYLLNKNNNQN